MALKVFIFCLFFNTTLAAQSSPFLAEILKFEQQDSANAPILRGQIMAYGSSTIKLWQSLETDLAFQGLKIVNRGFGGSNTAHAIYYFDRVVLPHRPKWLFFYEGDNDIWSGTSVDTVFQDHQIFISMVQKYLPKTQLVVFSIKPSPSRISALDKQMQLNERLKNYCKPLKNVYFLDAGSSLLNEKGEPDPQYFIKDMLHMNPSGYARWAEKVKVFYGRLKK